MCFDHFLTITKKQYIAKAIERWARWTVDKEVSGSLVPFSLGYGKGAWQRALDGPPSGKQPVSPQSATMEMNIERALWRFQDMDGRSVAGMQVTAYRLKHVAGMSNPDGAEALGVSLATYKRYVANVHAFIMTEVFDGL